MQYPEVLALSSMLFLSTAYFPSYLFHNSSSLIPYLGPSLRGKLEILTVFPHPVLISLPRHLLPHFILIPPKASLLHIHIHHSHSLLVLFSYQFFYLSLLLSLLTMYHWLFDQLVLIFPPQQPVSLMPWLTPAPWLLLSHTRKLEQWSLCSHSLIFAGKDGFLSLYVAF